MILVDADYTVDKSNRRVRWSEREILVLRDAVQSGMDIAEIVNLLGRSESAIASQAFRLDLTIVT